MMYQTGTGQITNQRLPQYQPKNNISFNTEVQNHTYQRDSSDYVKRKESIGHNNFLRSTQQHSPSNNKSVVGENGSKMNLRSTINS